jgi:signal transduction histidine kinase
MDSDGLGRRLPVRTVSRTRSGGVPTAVIALLLALVVALLAAELTMRPSSADRLLLVAVFAGVTAVAVLTAVITRRVTARSLRRAVVGIVVSAIGVAAFAVLSAAASMFLSGHDLRLVLVALGFGVVSGLVLAWSLTGTLLADLHAVGLAARRAAGGSRDARTGVDRPDEVGDVARALDDLIERLDAAEQQRARTESARREFLAATSHDLRTPLTALRGAIEALQDGVADDPDRYLRAMQRDIEYLGSLVDDLWLLTQIELGEVRLQLESLDLAELADEAVEALGPAARSRDIRMQLQVEGPVPLTGGARELGRVLRNLLDNAIRHSPPGSTVIVEVLAAPQPQVCITDAGPGFPEGFGERAFEAFTRADTARVRNGTGAGLGLAIARGFVQAHGGTIGIAEGPGGRVVVRLPAPQTP